jgi:hypothetical protein
VEEPGSGLGLVGVWEEGLERLVFPLVRLEVMKMGGGRRGKRRKDGVRRDRQSRVRDSLG